MWELCPFEISRYIHIHVHCTTVICASAYWKNILIFKHSSCYKHIVRSDGKFLEWGTLPWQYGIVPVTLALALLITFFFVFHGLKTGCFFFCNLLKLNFICYLNRFITFDYGGRHTFLRAKTNFNSTITVLFVVKMSLNLQFDCAMQYP